MTPSIQPALGRRGPASLGRFLLRESHEMTQTLGQTPRAGHLASERASLSSAVRIKTFNASVSHSMCQADNRGPSRRASPRLAQRDAAARSDGLGHYVASLMLAGGADISTVSKLLGHASTSITADVCAHVLAAIGQRPAEGAAVLIAYTVHTQQAVKADASQGSWWLRASDKQERWSDWRDLNSRPLDPQRSAACPRRSPDVQFSLQIRICTPGCISVDKTQMVVKMVVRPIAKLSEEA